MRVAAWQTLWRICGASGWPATPLQKGHVRVKTLQVAKNDGWTDLRYELSNDPELNDKVSHILNEACHVFYHHADGSWKSVAKEYYASLLAREFSANEWLPRILLGLCDRVVSMVVYRAIEITKGAENSTRSDGCPDQ